VLVKLQLDAIDEVAAAAIEIARSFVDDPNEGMFAADFAASFLTAALDGDDLAGMQHLIDTLRHDWRYARPRIALAHQPAPAIHVDSAPYLVWLGRNDRWARPVGNETLCLKRTDAGVWIGVGFIDP